MLVKRRAIHYPLETGGFLAPFLVGAEAHARKGPLGPTTSSQAVIPVPVPAGRPPAAPPPPQALPRVGRATAGSGRCGLQPRAHLVGAALPGPRPPVE